MSNDHGSDPQNPGQQPPAYPGVPQPPQQPPYLGAAPTPQPSVPPVPRYPGAAPQQPVPPQPAPGYAAPGQQAPGYAPTPGYPTSPYGQPAAPAYGQPGYGQPGYGQPGYGQPGAPTYGQPYGLPYAAPLKSNGLAITSLICGIAGFVFCWIAYLVIPFLASVAAVITGHMALGRIKRDPQLGGKGLAVTGLVLGYVGALINLIIGGLVIFAFVFAANYGNSY